MAGSEGEITELRWRDMTRENNKNVLVAWVKQWSLDAHEQIDLYCKPCGYMAGNRSRFTKH